MQKESVWCFVQCLVISVTITFLEPKHSISQHYFVNGYLSCSQELLAFPLKASQIWTLPVRSVITKARLEVNFDVA